jgi:hypothetical protein
MICPKCQTVWPDELKAVLKFCGACGAAMESTTEEPSAARVFAAIPLLSASQPGGDLRFVPVVFADLAGFTAFAEDRAPDEVAKLLGICFSLLGNGPERYWQLWSCCAGARMNPR